VKIIAINSPGSEADELKNQDRLHTETVENTLYAIVCDGVSSSSYSEQGAQFAAENVMKLFQDGGIKLVVDKLENMRTELYNKPVLFSRGTTDATKKIIEEVMQEKRKSAFQTTFIAVKAEESKQVSAVGCGDSAMFIFEPTGKLLHTNIDVKNDLIHHTMSSTMVIPDCFVSEAESLFRYETNLANDAEILLCSDGFYECFDSVHEIVQWLKNNQSTLAADDNQPLMETLHDKLNSKKGDDDISFIWLLPE
jgi:serine/threonine protein phosphatase PrpC